MDAFHDRKVLQLEHVFTRGAGIIPDILKNAPIFKSAPKL